MNFSLHDYGNAREKQNADGTWAFTCQHGTAECDLNIATTCAQHLYPDTDKWFPFVLCLAKASKGDVQACAKSSGLDYSKINELATSKEGNALQHAEAVATGNLQPPHKWTPWVTIDGTALTQKELDQPLVKLVCAAYKGSNPPAACKRSIEVCHRE